jgi:hypothetical protein
MKLNESEGYWETDNDGLEKELELLYEDLQQNIFYEYLK